MLKLKEVLAGARVRQSALALALGLSDAAISLLVNHGAWPKSLDRADLEGRISDFLIARGAGLEAVATAFEEVVPDRANDPAPVSNEGVHNEGVEMLIRKQKLSQEAKEHFRLKRDPFDMEVECQEDVFLTPRLRERLDDMESAILRARFIAVAGESGSGKTTLRELIEERLQGQNVKIIKIYTGGMEESASDGRKLRTSHIEEAIIYAIDPLSKPKRSPQLRGKQVRSLLIEYGGPVALVFEEAHRLPLSTFRHLKGLREDNKNGMKIILGVLLIGQTELAQRLSESNPAIREVVQRCELLTLEPLGKNLAAYIAHRFSRAGIIQADQVFEPAAIDAISRKLTLTEERSVRSGGTTSITKNTTSLVYPLAVGNVAIAAMNLAAHMGAPKVTAEIVVRC